MESSLSCSFAEDFPVSQKHWGTNSHSERIECNVVVAKWKQRRVFLFYDSYKTVATARRNEVVGFLSISGVKCFR